MQVSEASLSYYSDYCIVQYSIIYFALKSSMQVAGIFVLLTNGVLKAAGDSWHLVFAWSLLRFHVVLRMCWFNKFTSFIICCVWNQVLGSLAPDVSDTDVNTPKFSASEMKNATSERDELQQKVNSAVEVLEQYQPE